METNKPKIWLSSPHMGDNEFKYVQEAFELNWIAPVGPHILRFEKELAKCSENQPCVALSSGTAAIHLALILLGVSSDDYVICQSLTFAASANPIRYQGATPVFVDSEKDTWNISPEYLEEAINNCLKGEFISAKGNKISGKAKLPKAIIPVHLYGMPANMPEIKRIADRYGIPIIEDAAEALGSTLHSKNCGSWGEIGVFSFNGNKIITTSGGGALTAKNQEWVNRAKFLSTQAREDAPHYEHRSIGYNYRLSNVSAAIGIGQLEQLPNRINARRDNFEFYRKIFKPFPQFSFLKEPEGYFSNRWLSTVLIEGEPDSKSREALRLSLEKENIESRPIWKPMHLQPVFSEFPYVGENVSADIFQNGLCLPSGSSLTLEEKERIESAINNILMLSH